MTRSHHRPPDDAHDPRGRLMVQAAREYNRIFQVGSQQRSMWQNYAGCELIRKGGLGKVTKVIAYNYPSPWECGLPAQPVPDELDWEMGCGPNPLVPFNQDLICRARIQAGFRSDATAAAR